MSSRDSESDIINPCFKIFALSSDDAGNPEEDHHMFRLLDCEDSPSWVLTTNDDGETRDEAVVFAAALSRVTIANAPFGLDPPYPSIFFCSSETTMWGDISIQIPPFQPVSTSPSNCSSSLFDSDHSF
ncbi:hypothetical protein V6N11_013828 [Hibiscus sabdariffa]|uniref:Uncharacterized protein n=1 Tax=Hibiscus sabdariffa TaxID=183260 RepID=A0ABR1ZC81_9ROSI